MEACSKCNFVLAPEASECPACGVILAKLKAISGLQRQIRIEPPPLAVPPPLGVTASPGPGRQPLRAAGGMAGIFVAASR